ncbi:MAG: endonuclease/exonuclease/phosphatase family protein [bacterium]|nr:endonuclease/exonuclease/phosphatase family protein [bacterium]
MTAIPRKRLPAGPIAVTLALVLGGLYLMLRPTTPSPVEPAADGVIRVASWKLATGLGQRSGGVTAIAATLRELAVDVIAIQGLQDETLVAALGQALGAGWQHEAVPGWDGRQLAILVGPKTAIAAYHLVPGRDPLAGDAVALTLQASSRASFLVVCHDVGGSDRDPEMQRQYLDGVLSWSRDHQVGTIVLAGPTNLGSLADQETANRLGTLAEISSGPSQLRVAPARAVVAQVPVGSAATASIDGSAPVALDVSLGVTAGNR